MKYKIDKGTFKKDSEGMYKNRTENDRNFFEIPCLFILRTRKFSTSQCAGKF